MIEIFCDGLCEPQNPEGIATYGYVIYRDGQRIHDGIGVVDAISTSNNVAEYTALIQALSYLQQCNEKIVVKSDSELLIKQIIGEYEVRAKRIIPLYREATALIKKFPQISFVWIPREENAEADKLSGKAYIEHLQSHPELVEKFSEFFATEKQKAFLRKLKIDFHPFISKRQASRLIEEKVGKGK